MMKMKSSKSNANVKKQMKALDRDTSGSWRKFKKIRNAFSTAITTGRRSRAGRTIMEKYGKLVLIYGGVPSVEPLAFGSDTASGIHIDDYNNGEEGRCSDEDNASTHHAASNNNSPSNNSSNNNSINGNSSSLKRKNTDNPVPKLIDEKRRHLEKGLSARQRDQLLFSEAKINTQLANINTQVMSSSNFSCTHSKRFGCSSRVVPQTCTPNIYHDRTIPTSN